MARSPAQRERFQVLGVVDEEPPEASGQHVLCFLAALSALILCSGVIKLNSALCLPRFRFTKLT